MKQNQQLTLFDVFPALNVKYYGKPEFNGEKDEIVRLSIEQRFENTVPLNKCKCGGVAQVMLISCKEFFVKCKRCGTRTKYFRYAFQAKQKWNRYTDGIDKEVNNK